MEKLEIPRYIKQFISDKSSSKTQRIIGLQYSQEGDIPVTEPLQLPSIPNNCWKSIPYDEVHKYDIDNIGDITKDETSGTTLKTHQLIISSKYPNYLFYLTTHFNNNPEKKNLGIMRKQEFIYRKFNNKNEKGEVRYVIQNNKDPFYTHKTLVSLFNYEVNGKCI